MSGRPTYARYITDLRTPNHIPSLAELRPTRPRTLPDKTDIQLTICQESFFWHIWKISPWHFCQSEQKPIPNWQNRIKADFYVFTFNINTSHWHNTGSWNPSSCKTMTYVFYIVKIMAVDDLAMQGARASATIILTMLNQINLVPTR